MPMWVGSLNDREDVLVQSRFLIQMCPNDREGILVKIL